MRNLEFEIVTASFMPSSVDLGILGETMVYEIRGEILIPETSNFCSTIQSSFGDLYGDLHIAFFANAITIFGISTFTISSESHYYSEGKPIFSHLYFPSSKELAISFRGKILKTYFPLDHLFEKETVSSVVDSFFFHNKKTKCVIFKGWEKEFTSLDELIQFLSGYMLIS